MRLIQVWDAQWQMRGVHSTCRERSLKSTLMASRACNFWGSDMTLFRHSGCNCSMMRCVWQGFGSKISSVDALCCTLSPWVFDAIGDWDQGFLQKAPGPEEIHFQKGGKRRRRLAAPSDGCLERNARNDKYDRGITRGMTSVFEGCLEPNAKNDNYDSFPGPCSPPQGPRLWRQ